jgi:hypothetical protein
VIVKAAALKLGVATLYRVTECPKKIANFEIKKNLASSVGKKPKIGLEHTFWGVVRFFKGRQPKKFENP